MASFIKTNHNGKSNQKILTAKKIIEDFKAKKKNNLTEEDAEKYIDLIYFFSEQAFKLYNASKTCNPVEFNSIEPKKQRI
ncbi:hypothetical protein [Pedobacter boryungensis]|uniref:Uncharacterized protein n=1 Tax=Pedobacter boryungensis TaxID=869962 RepID=A0ABX2DDB1_9SPHI|nr:hypothetical protein [Pedobacter boryungensis]NQX32083.1 hypothetical protein [Pedobacter boryungensis]